jgi:poly [ADP-ribose] polymerase
LAVSEFNFNFNSLFFFILSALSFLFFPLSQLLSLSSHNASLFPLPFLLFLCFGERLKFFVFSGSPTANFIGILSQGLRIAPPEAPASGYMFGKGIYFADMAQKSWNYTRHSGTGRVYMLLCEVALGNIFEAPEPTYMEQPPQGFNSTRGLGRTGPDWNKKLVLPNGVSIPMGHVITYPDPSHRLRLQHNEYIVYNVSQVRMRYLVQIDSSYRRGEKETKAKK